MKVILFVQVFYSNTMKKKRIGDGLTVQMRRQQNLHLSSNEDEVCFLALCLLNKKIGKQNNWNHIKYLANFDLVL